MRELSTEHARKQLSLMGFAVSDIGIVPNEKRADLLASFEEEEYVIEAKLREPHSKWKSLIEDVSKNGTSNISRDVKPWNALSSTIKEAYLQLQDTPASPNAFRLLWIVAPHNDSEFVIKCLKIRLLGTADLVIINGFDCQPSIKKCYHYFSNDFERSPQLDAVVIGDKKSGQLLVNCYSKNKATFRASKLYTFLDKSNAVIDPEIHSKDGSYLIISTEFNGIRDGKSQWQYLKDKYGIQTSLMYGSYFNGLVDIQLGQP